MANIDVAGNKQPKALHAGVNEVWQRVSVSATTSAGDVFQVIKIPHGAVIDKVVVYPGAAYVAALGMRIGLSSTHEAFFASATYSVASNLNYVLPAARGARVSVSDESPLRYEYLTIRPGAAVTVGHQFDVNVAYSLDQVT